MTEPPPREPDEIIVKRWQAAVYPPPRDELPWLVVIFEPRRTTALGFETEAEARKALADETLKYAREQAAREKRQGSEDAEKTR